MQWQRDLTEVFHGMVSSRRQLNSQMKSISLPNSHDANGNTSSGKEDKASHPILRPVRKSAFVASCKVVVRSLAL